MVDLPRQLVAGRLVERYKRFLADVCLDDGPVVTAHCPNPGRMIGISAAGTRVWLAPTGGQARLPYRWVLAEADNGAMTGVLTTLPNSLLPEAIAGGWLPELAGYGRHRREQRYGRGSRIDWLLDEGDAPPCYVEVKNVHLRRDIDRTGPGTAEFPDAVTARGARHMQELAAEVARGNRAAVVFVVQRGDVARFAVACDIDPAYARALAEAQAQGVAVLALACHVTDSGVTPAQRLAIALPCAA